MRITRSITSACKYNPNPAGSQINSNETELQCSHGCDELTEVHLQILTAEITLVRRINRRFSFLSTFLHRHLLFYGLRQKRLIVHNGPCACTTLPLLFGSGRRYLREGDKRRVAPGWSNAPSRKIGNGLSLHSVFPGARALVDRGLM